MESQVKKYLGDKNDQLKVGAVKLVLEDLDLDKMLPQLGSLD